MTALNSFELLYSSYFLKATAGAALTLALTACGGDSDGSAKNNKAATNKSTVNAITSVVGDTMLRVFSYPHMTIFDAGVTGDAEGKEFFAISTPNVEDQTTIIKNRDTEGNVTALASAGPFSGITSLLGNRAGMLCKPILDADGHQLSDSGRGIPAERGRYVYLSNDFIEATPQEVIGKTFKHYINCLEVGSIFINEKGEVTNLDDPSEKKYKAQWEEFTEAGRKKGVGTSAVIRHAKVYKYSDQGKTTYAIVNTVSLDPDVPEADPSEQRIYLTVSQ